LIPSLHSTRATCTASPSRERSNSDRKVFSLQPGQQAPPVQSSVMQFLRTTAWSQPHQAFSVEDISAELECTKAPYNIIRKSSGVIYPSRTRCMFDRSYPKRMALGGKTFRLARPNLSCSERRTSVEGPCLSELQLELHLTQITTLLHLLPASRVSRSFRDSAGRDQTLGSSRS
jgi:hypothetical protein